jgi:hypothetical protein
MTLIDADRATELYAVMPPAIEASGGSAANTMAGRASLSITDPIHAGALAVPGLRIATF